ncbi:MAG: type II toxin-antitoxin system VapC family toxin [Chthoniobacterales bacterium]
MNSALDTQAYSDFCRGSVKVKESVQLSDRVILPLIILAELQAGFQVGNKGRENERVLKRFLARHRVDVINPDGETTHHYGRLFLQLKTQGTPIPTNDLWIAALVQQHNLVLESDDSHFDYLPQLNRYRGEEEGSKDCRGDRGDSPARSQSFRREGSTR